MCRKARLACTAASSVLAGGARLGERGVAVFSWSPSAPPLSLWRWSRGRLSLCVSLWSRVRAPASAHSGRVGRRPPVCGWGARVLAHAGE